MAKPITNRVKTSKTPVIRKDLEGGVVAEANNDGSIYVDKSVKKGSPLEKEAIAHEKVHIDQMKRGDLNYDDDNVQWKGKLYPRSTMNEGAKQLPWEKEAYDKTKHMNNKKKTSPNKMTDADLVANNKQTHSKFNDVASAMPKQKSLTSATETESPTKMKATPITYKASALKRTIASKEFAATYGDKDKPKKTTKSERVIKGGKVGTLTTETSTTPSQRGADGKIRRIGGKQGSYRMQDLVGSSRDGVAYTERTGEQMVEAGIIHRKNADAWNNKFYKPTASKPGSTTETEVFKPEQVKTPGTPGKESVYAMGGWEAANRKSRGNIEYSASKQSDRRRQRDSRKWDRSVKKGKTLYDNGVARDMTPEGKADFMLDRAKSDPNFYTQTGVNSGGTLSKLGGIEAATPENTPGSENLRNLDKKANSKVDLKTGLLPEDAVKSTANLKGSSYKALKTPKKINAAKKTNAATEELTPKRTRDTPAGYNTTNKNKSAFKMNGYGSKLTKK